MNYLVACGDYDMPPDDCYAFACNEATNDTCLNLPTSSLPPYFTSTDSSLASHVAFRASIAFMENYEFRLRVVIYAYYSCMMPIFNIDA